MRRLLYFLRKFLIRRKTMKKTLVLLLALVMVSSVFASGATETKTTATAATEAAGPSSISVCIASEPDTIDPALNSSVDGATLCAHLFSGLAKWGQAEDGTLTLVADAAVELSEGVQNADGSVTYTYTLRDMKWSDGKDVTASDFAFAWKRAASTELGADYGYMFEVVKGYPDDLAVEALDDKTLQVTTSSFIAYWNELLAFPTYFPVREDVVADEGWATDPSTYVSNGMYYLADWSHNSVITLKKNENHPDAASVTMDEIKFYLSDDANNMLSNFETGAWQLIDDVPTEEIPSLKVKYPTEFVVAGQIGTYYVCWNINQELLPADSTLTGDAKAEAEAEIRRATALLIDRNYICEEIGQAGQEPASSFVAMGITNADGSQFYQTAGGTDKSYYGYYDVSEDAIESNYNEAVEILKKYYDYDEKTGMFTNFPTLTYLYNTSSGHKAIGEYLQSAFAAVGINLVLENQEWNTFLNTRKAGDYSIARNGWLADYNDAICFLDMWTTASGNNDVQYGKGANADVAIYSLDLTAYGYDTKVEKGTWSETYDVLISTIKSCTDLTVRCELMHLAEDMLMESGCIVPLYYYTDIYMLDDSVKGFFSNPLGYKYFMYCTIEG
jgi:ABC-type oligopeptide transport system substrate-binding subunit